MTLANFFTCLRVLLIPVFMAVYYADFTGHFLLSSAIFILACVTDWLDGHMARRMRQTSRFGAFLDPVADKLLVTITLVILAASYSTPWYTIPAALIVAREVLVSALREWMAQIGASKSVAVHFVGKLKTTVQMVAIPFLLFNGQLFGVIDTHVWGTGLIWIASILTIWSMIYYMQKALPEIRARVK